MALRDDDPLSVLEAQLLRDDPKFARGMASGHPCRPREYRNQLAWVPVGLTGAILMAAGIRLENAPILILSLFVIGVAGYLLGPEPARGSHPSLS